MKMKEGQERVARPCGMQLRAAPKPAGRRPLDVKAFDRTGERGAG